MSWSDVNELLQLWTSIITNGSISLELNCQKMNWYWKWKWQGHLYDVFNVNVFAYLTWNGSTMHSMYSIRRYRLQQLYGTWLEKHVWFVDADYAGDRKVRRSRTELNTLWIQHLWCGCLSDRRPWKHLCWDRSLLLWSKEWEQFVGYDTSYEWWVYRWQHVSYSQHSKTESMLKKRTSPTNGWVSNWMQIVMQQEHEKITTKVIAGGMKRDHLVGNCMRDADEHWNSGDEHWNRG